MCDDILREIRELSSSSSTDELVRACALGHLEAVVSLIESGVPVNDSRCGQLPPLHAACASGHCGIVEYLIGQGADVSKKWKESTALYAALSRGRASVVRTLVDRNARLVSALSRQFDQDGSLLHIVRSSGYLKPSSLRKRLAADPNDPCLGRSTPLEVCVEIGDVETMIFLLERGATDQILGTRRLATLACVTTRNDNGAACLRALVERDAEAIDLHLCLRLALSVKNDRCSAYLVDELKMICGPAQLVALCSSGQARLARKLLRNGADPNSGSPLIPACVQGHHECVKALLEYGADPSHLTYHLQRCCAIALSELERPNARPAAIDECQVVVDDLPCCMEDSDNLRSMTTALLLSTTLSHTLTTTACPSPGEDDSSSSSSTRRPHSVFVRQRRRRKCSHRRRRRQRRIPFEEEADIRAAIKRHRRSSTTDADLLVSSRDSGSVPSSPDSYSAPAGLVVRQPGIHSSFFFWQQQPPTE